MENKMENKMSQIDQLQQAYQKAIANYGKYSQLAKEALKEARKIERQVKKLQA